MATFLKPLYNGAVSLPKSLYNAVASIPKTVSTVSSAASSYLPQNDHAKKVAQINQRITTLHKALAENSNDSYKTCTNETQEKLKEQKQKIESDLVNLNGAYYQDPISLLKKAWDTVLNTTNDALGKQPKARCELTPLQNELKAATDQSNPKIQSALTAIDKYVGLEKDRDNFKTQLNTIISIQKTSPNISSENDPLLLEKNKLLQDQKELCGNYYQDPNGLLDKAWKAYQKAVDSGSPDANTLLNTYKKLERKRKTIETRLLALEEQISITPHKDRSIQTLTIASINKEIEELGALKTDEAKLSGVNWKETVIKAATIASEAAIFAGITALL